MRASIIAALPFVFSLLGSTAHATPARVTALSANPGFLDKTDFFWYPSALSGVGRNAWMNYNGGLDAGLSWDDQALFISRNTLNFDLLGLGPQGGWNAAWFKAEGGTGYSARLSLDPAQNDRLVIGGAWGSGEHDVADDRATAFGGDLVWEGGLDDPEFGIYAFGRGRHVTSDRLSEWEAIAGYEDETITAGGFYHMGPRFEVAPDTLVALALGPGLILELDSGDATGVVYMPLSNIGVEYYLRPWLAFRGSATAALMAVYDGSDVSADTAVAGNLGFGLVRERANVDFTVDPMWFLNGPFLLSGVSQPMAAVVSLRIDL